MENSKGLRSFRIFMWIFLTVVVLLAFAISYFDLGSVLYLGPSPSDASSRVLLPSGEPSDVQMDNEIIITNYYNKRQVVPEGQPLPAYPTTQAAKVNLGWLASSRIGPINSNRNYTLRWLQRDGSAFQFSGPTAHHIKNNYWWLGGYGTGILADPQKCDMASTLVVQLIFQNKNPKTKTYGREYVLKEVTRQVEGQVCS